MIAAELSHVAVITDVYHTHSPMYDKKVDGDQKAAKVRINLVQPCIIIS